MFINIAIAFILGAILGSVITHLLKSKSSDTNNDADSAADIPSKTLYVGNLPYRANEAAIRAHFGQHGQVVSVRLMKDRNTGRRKGYGFVEMAAKDIANVIEKLNDTEFQERTLKVREANERSRNDNEAANS